MTHFREALKGSLSDLGFIRSKFMWMNCRQDDSFTKERLDMNVANSGWCQMYKKVEVRTLVASDSDHKPMHVTYLEHLQQGLLL
jgi:hypothetical protein